MRKRRRFLNQWFTLNYYGTRLRAKCIDIEFETNIGKPLFLMQSKAGDRFWLTREEIKEHELTR